MVIASPFSDATNSACGGSHVLSTCTGRASTPKRKVFEMTTVQRRRTTEIAATRVDHYRYMCRQPCGSHGESVRILLHAWGIGESTPPDHLGERVHVRVQANALTVTATEASADV